MIQPKIASAWAEIEWKWLNASFLTGNKTKTLCVDQQIPHVGTAIWTVLVNYLIAQIDNRRIQTVLLAFIARNST
jgi:hypothetical protein